MKGIVFMKDTKGFSPFAVTVITRNIAFFAWRGSLYTFVSTVAVGEQKSSASIHPELKTLKKKVKPTAQNIQKKHTWSESNIFLQSFPETNVHPFNVHHQKWSLILLMGIYWEGCKNHNNQPQKIWERWRHLVLCHAERRRDIWWCSQSGSQEAGKRGRSLWNHGWGVWSQRNCWYLQ